MNQDKFFIEVDERDIDVKIDEQRVKINKLRNHLNYREKELQTLKVLRAMDELYSKLEQEE